MTERRAQSYPGKSDNNQQHLQEADQSSYEPLSCPDLWERVRWRVCEAVHQGTEWDRKRDSHSSLSPVHAGSCGHCSMTGMSHSCSFDGILFENLSTWILFLSPVLLFCRSDFAGWACGRWLHFSSSQLTPPASTSGRCCHGSPWKFAPGRNAVGSKLDQFKILLFDTICLLFQSKFLFLLFILRFNLAGWTLQRLLRNDWDGNRYPA